MNRDVIQQRPAVSRAILITGATLYALVCIPSIRQRGYPEIDPFWDALPWLWLAPIALAEVFSSGIRQRWRMLALYAVVTAFIDAGATVDFVPHHPDIISMSLMTIVLYGPIHLVGTGLLAALCQFVLSGLRELKDAQQAVVSAPRLRTLTYGIAVLVFAFCFPFVYRHLTYADAQRSGERRAEADWREGSAVWYVHSSESNYFDACFADGTFSPETGLPLKAMHGGPVSEVFYRSYRNVVQHKLARFGRPKIADELLTPADVQALIDSHQCRRVMSFPFRHGDMSLTSPRRYTIGNKEYALLGGDAVYSLVVTNRQGILLVVSDNDVLTFTSGGQLLQRFNCCEHKIDAAEGRIAGIDTGNGEANSQRVGTAP